MSNDLEYKIKSEITFEEDNNTETIIFKFHEYIPLKKIVNTQKEAEEILKIRQKAFIIALKICLNPKENSNSETRWNIDISYKYGPEKTIFKTLKLNVPPKINNFEYTISLSYTKETDENKQKLVNDHILREINRSKNLLNEVQNILKIYTQALPKDYESDLIKLINDTSSN